MFGSSDDLGSFHGLGRVGKGFLKFIFLLRLYMIVKSDHLSKFSKLSNWKEET